MWKGDVLMDESFAFFCGVGAAIAAALIFCAGWAVAHTTVAVECSKLGSFYVGGKSFQCAPKEQS